MYTLTYATPKRGQKTQTFDATQVNKLKRAMHRLYERQIESTVHDASGNLVGETFGKWAYRLEIWS